MSLHENSPAKFDEFCEWLELDYAIQSDEVKKGIDRIYYDLTEESENGAERHWRWDLNSHIPIRERKAFYESCPEINAYYNVYFERVETATYTIKASSEAEANEIAKKLRSTPAFLTRLNRDFSDDEESRVSYEIGSPHVTKPEGHHSLSEATIKSYLKPTGRHATMAVDFQFVERGYDVTVETVTFNVAPALDSLYQLANLPVSYENLHDDPYNYGDDLYLEAVSLGLCKAWDGPFSAYLEYDYQTYLGQRLAEELGSLDKVLDWLNDNCDEDFRQLPEEDWPDYAVETYDAAQEVLTPHKDEQAR